MSKADDKNSSTQSASDRKKAAFRSRIISTLCLWGLVGAGLISAHPVLFYFLILTFVLLGMIEYFRILRSARVLWEGIFTTLIAVGHCSACFWLAAHGRYDHFGFFDSLAIVAVIFVAFGVNLNFPIKPGRSHISVMASVFGFIYIAFLFNFVTRISFFQDGFHTNEVPGRGYLFFLLAVTKFTDAGAYAIGSLIGKHKMIPHISPGKTWEGFAGAFLGAFVAAFVVTGFFGDDMPLLTTLHTCVLAVIIGLAAILGDLAESIVKRSLITKDSGHVMPGIGGVLDLIDSILFTAPIMYCYLYFLSR
tara:strand:- start:7045 stop:7962 length:918 start_codon:yes stop_codon:yes gene_type:complete